MGECLPTTSSDGVDESRSSQHRTDPQQGRRSTRSEVNRAPKPAGEPRKAQERRIENRPLVERTSRFVLCEVLSRHGSGGRLPVLGVLRQGHRRQRLRPRLLCGQGRARCKRRVQMRFDPPVQRLSGTLREVRRPHCAGFSLQPVRWPGAGNGGRDQGLRDRKVRVSEEDKSKHVRRGRS